MKKTTPLKILNPILLVLILAQFLTILVPKIWPSLYLGEIHELNGYLFGAVLLLHLFLNRAWVKSTYFARKPKAE